MMPNKMKYKPASFALVMPLKRKEKTRMRGDGGDG